MSDRDHRIPVDRVHGHTPVLVEATLERLSPGPGEVMLDATVGRGGHAEAILPRLAPGGRYIGLDLDAENVAYARRRLDRVAQAKAAGVGEAAGEGGGSVGVVVRKGDFAEGSATLEALGVERVDLLLADLGFASTQMDNAERGMSFTADAPLDMRLDRESGPTAAALLATLGEGELADILWRFGEERFSRRIARKIVERRRDKPISTTRDLADLCASAYGPSGRRQRVHPATRAFMALRIAVNRELERLESLLETLPRLMAPGGRAAIISFHSLEDRAVKRAFRRYADAGAAERLTRKPVIADEAERAVNPRSRSAKLRAVRWVGLDAGPTVRWVGPDPGRQGRAPKPGDRGPGP